MKYQMVCADPHYWRYWKSIMNLQSIVALKAIRDSSESGRHKFSMAVISQVQIMDSKCEPWQLSSHHASFQLWWTSPAFLHLQPGLGSRRRCQPLPEDCGWQGERCAGGPARPPFSPSPWSFGGKSGGWKSEPAAWSETPSPSSWTWTPGARCC